jgi:hypothetical protein
VITTRRGPVGASAREHQQAIGEREPVISVPATAAEADSASWQSRAACLDCDLDLFFPIAPSGPALQQIEQVKAVSARCPAPGGTAVPRTGLVALSCPAAGCGRFHPHAHLRVTPHGGAGSYRPRERFANRAGPLPAAGPGHGRGDDSETNPYPEAEGSARALLE